MLYCYGTTFELICYAWYVKSKLFTNSIHAHDIDPQSSDYPTKSLQYRLRRLFTVGESKITNVTFSYSITAYRAMANALSYAIKRVQQFNKLKIYYQKNPQKLYGKMWSQLSWLNRTWRQGLHRLGIRHCRLLAWWLTWMWIKATDPLIWYMTRKGGIQNRIRRLVVKSLKASKAQYLVLKRITALLPRRLSDFRAIRRLATWTSSRLDVLCDIKSPKFVLKSQNKVPFSPESHCRELVATLYVGRYK